MIKKSVFFQRLLIVLFAITVTVVYTSCLTSDSEDVTDPLTEKKSTEELLARMEEAKQKIDNYSKELAAEYDLPDVKSDPWVNSWQAVEYKKKLIVTVHRKFDVVRAEKLLQEYDFVQVVFDEHNAEFCKSDISAEEAAGFGILEMQRFEHEFRELPKQGLWQAAIMWDGPTTKYTVIDFWMEVYDEIKAEWYKIPDIYTMRINSPPHNMQTGKNEFFVATAAWLSDFQPGQYRFIYGIETIATKDRLMFIGEFEITEENAA